MTLLTRKVTTFGAVSQYIYMDKQTVVITVIVVLALFVWVPAIVLSVHQVLRNYKNQNNKK